MFSFDMFSSVCSHLLFYREDRSTNNRLMYDHYFICHGHTSNYVSNFVRNKILSIDKYTINEYIYIYYCLRQLLLLSALCYVTVFHARTPRTQVQ